MAAFEDLFDAKGPCSRCWCMYWRIRAAYRRRPPEENKAAFHQIVETGPPPGLLAFIDNQAVGWCQLTPRGALPQLDRERRLKRIDTLPVWSISCFYIRIGFRRKGVTSALITAALQAAKAAHAPALEAYPLDADKTPSTSSTGYATTFVRAGFEVIVSHTPPRPIMRHNLKSITPPSKKR
jgi:GNAT superfamily N-acetyltransferase